ncbi:MAG: endonuclease III [Desulfovibrionaceae bacterium]|nr:endonuclease III [Desulfovibrionaceae bacterium]
MPPSDRARAVLCELTRRYPHPKTNLEAETPWQLLVATILSAQCTDERVNALTKDLFARYPDAPSLAQASLADIETMIRPAGFFRAKARYLAESAALVCKRFGGLVPRTIPELMLLPGVARKTANVVLFGAYGINEGFAVDTHVGRISRRLGLTEATNPVRIEQDLMGLFPQDSWGDLNHRMVWFGREQCRARKPLCATCGMRDFCPKIGV